ncbi:Thiopurine S-methyltransferase [hydrothermal vent metagenome]|uniref:Thiopurine S-methyltransferase n=1 Tax=hydrothermal vent metagenome TaxID=652676 RepID=A0A3B0QU23_9ZZZZ
MDLTETFWDNRYKTKVTGWDLGKISTPLKTYFDQLTDKNLKILIPGGGNSHEAEYLNKKGFKNVYVVDLSKTALKNVKKRVSSFPESHLIHNDFFKLSKVFDLIIEQTFFCALHPSLRSDYAKKMAELLTKNGKLVGLFFNVPLYQDHPPFGGNKKEYLGYFKPYFNIEIMDKCYNSNESRKGEELFVKLIKK